MKRLRVSIEVTVPDLPHYDGHNYDGHTALDYARAIEATVAGAIVNGELEESGHYFEMDKLWLCGMDVTEDH